MDVLIWWVSCIVLLLILLLFFKQKTAYEMRISDWSSDVCSSDPELFLDPKLFARYKAVYDKRNSSGLDAQQIRIVERSYDEMVRDGANLSPADKTKLVANHRRAQL